MNKIPQYDSVEHWRAELAHEIFLYPECRQLCSTRAEITVNAIDCLEDFHDENNPNLDFIRMDSNQARHTLVGLLRGLCSPILAGDIVVQWKQLRTKYAAEQTET